MAKQININPDKEARDARMALDTAILAIDSDGKKVSVIRGLCYAAEVAGVCALILDSLEPSDQTDYSRFTSLEKEAKDIIEYFNERYEVSLVEVGSESHTVETAEPGTKKRTIRHIEATEPFKQKAKGKRAFNLNKALYKLTLEQVKAIKKYLRSIEPIERGSALSIYREIAEMYGVSQSAIEHIHKGRSWTDVK